jgi:hypothetical protein
MRRCQRYWSAGSSTIATGRGWFDPADRSPLPQSNTVSEELPTVI